MDIIDIIDNNIQFLTKVTLNKCLSGLKRSFYKRLQYEDNMNNIGLHDNNTKTKLTLVLQQQPFSDHITSYLLLLNSVPYPLRL